MRPSVILNADAMQCYAALPILTAQPSAADFTAASHALYGMWRPEMHGNAQLWLQAATSEIIAAWARGLLPILVGGTGMYIRTLLEGFHAMPTIAEAVREEVRAMAHDTRRTLLLQHDPMSAATLKAGDTQRISRALEVVLSSGKPMAYYQAQPKTPPLPQAKLNAYVLDLPREALYARIDTRFDSMMAAGALEEVQAFLSAHPPLGTPIFKAQGLPELAAHLAGTWSLDAAVSKAKQHTRNYAKRQLTWARQQFGAWPRTAPDILPDLS